jgi:hypothetical protein
VDKTVNVRMFEVEAREGAMPFSQALGQIAARPLAAREREIEPDIVIRLERLTDQRGVIVGEMVRRQTANLPPKALEGQPLERLGVSSIGHTTAFIYDIRLSILALQIARNGITSFRMGLYAETLLGGAGYSILPVPNVEVWNKLRHGAVRAVTVRVAAPNDLEAADAEARSVRGGMMELKDALGSAHVEVTLSMGRRDANINRQRALSMFRWLHREREEERGGVSRLAADVIPADGEEVETLNLIHGQMGDNQRLNLPDDDPDGSFRMRSDYIQDILRAHRAELERRYG